MDVIRIGTGKVAARSRCGCRRGGHGASKRQSGKEGVAAAVPGGGVPRAAVKIVLAVFLARDEGDLGVGHVQHVGDAVGGEGDTSDWS